MGGLTSIDGDATDTIRFTVNGKEYTVDERMQPDTSLNIYLREHLNLRGTKSMCLEGGCGACIVAAKIRGVVMAVNSCLVPILTCDGWEITTIEGIGNDQSGYHPIQARLAQMNGSQCGYCSPGMVMNMYSLSKDKKLTMKEIENSFGSNICRCTGYRPILDAFKTLAVDADAELVKKVEDIQDRQKIKICANSGKVCNGGSCGTVKKATGQGYRHLLLDDAEFYKVVTINELFSVFEKYPNASYILNGGNTAHGVYRLEKRDLYIDVNDIPDLHRVTMGKDSLVLGANISLTEAMENFGRYSKTQGFEYLEHLAQHIDLIASIPVRNIGTMAGNLMIKHEHHGFPSDLFLMLETANARLHILSSPGDKKSVTLPQFLEMDMRHKLVYSIVLPSLASCYHYRSYKIMPRAQNAHAHVNAGFLFKLDQLGKVLEKPNIVFGAITHSFLHASKTEKYLTGKNLLDSNVFQQALKILNDELDPDHELPDYSPQFRKTLAEGLFYKCVLNIKSDKVNSRLRSGGNLLDRGISSGKQDFDTERNLWPLNKPMPKLEAIYQTSGEAQYINDIKTMPGEVFCAFVLTDVPNGFIEHIDTTEAMQMPGVVAFYDASDIPGRNVFVPADAKLFALPFDEPLFADKEVLYTGQPIGVIVATSGLLADKAAKKVKVIYTGAFSKKPILTITDVIESKDESRVSMMAAMPAQREGTDVKHVIKGTFSSGGQYAYTLETQTCICLPLEDGIEVYAATQWMDLSQIAIATCLGIQNNRVNIRVKRIGGGYGAKITRATQIACACALVCHKLKRPARFVMTLECNMRAIGKRSPARQEYEVGVDNNGTIQYMKSKTWSNAGAIFNDPISPWAAAYISNCYDSSTWAHEGYEARTDTPTNTYCRSPGSVEIIAMMENIMDHIAREIRMDPVDVRMANMNPADIDTMKGLIEDLKTSADYDTRRKSVESFNKDNRWKKKGIAILPMKWGFMYEGNFHSLLSCCPNDGTVSITVGGIEMGQGLNTKVAQVAAHKLGIDVDMVSVKPSSNLTSPSNLLSGGSFTSESCAYATMMACEELLKRLEPIKAELNSPTWKELLTTAHAKQVDLCTSYMFASSKANVSNYYIYGCAIAEVEVDLLTGQHIISRVDEITDAGTSMNPEIDVGQAEGAFMMGLGYWTCEDLMYDPETAVLMNDRTWNYKPPGAKDIPVDFRISFRKNAPNPVGVLGSKATGEPPTCLSYVVVLALRNALNAARDEAGNTDKWYNLDGPVTTEKILLSSLTSTDQMIL